MRNAFLAGLLLAAAADALAQPDQVEGTIVLTLDDAIDRGVRASARLREAGARTEMASAVAAQRRAASQPQVTVQAGYMRTNHVSPFILPVPGATGPVQPIYPDIPDNYRSRLDLQYPLYNAGRFTALEQAARSESAASDADERTARADLSLEIARAYWTLVTAIEQTRVLEQAIAAIQAHLNDARRRLDAGIVAPHEVLAVEAQEARERLMAIQARGNRDVAEADLARLIGAPQARIQPASPLAPPAPVTAGLPSLVAEAASRRSERAALSRRLTAAEERVKAAEVTNHPTVLAGGGFDYASPNPRFFPREREWHTSWDVGVNVGWPLFDGGRNRAEVAETSAATRAMRARIEEFDAVLSVEVRRAVTDLSSSIAAVETAGQGIRAAAEARRVANERFLAGVATSAEVLDAQVALLQAELDRTQALAAGRVAEARVARAVGK
jgi:multidrug efflux system outer membrane protein